MMNMRDDQERTVDRGGHGAASEGPLRGRVEEDPLAELIRIVKEEDPFGDMLDPPAAPESRDAGEGAPDAPAPRAPASLEPVDIEQALRDFRDAPGHEIPFETEDFDLAGPDAPDYRPAGEYQAAEDYGGAEAVAADESYAEAGFAADSGGFGEAERLDDDFRPHDPYNDPAFDPPLEEAVQVTASGAVATGALHAASRYDPDPVTAGEPDGPAPPPRRRGAFFVAGVGIGVIALAVVFVGLFRSGGGSVADSDQAPVIRASGAPSKVAPDDPGGATIPNQERLIYSRVAGGEEDEPDARLVTREESPLPAGADGKIGERFPGLAGGSAGGPTGSSGPGTLSVDKSNQGRAPAAPPPIAAAPSADSPLPRRVRTLAVGPDGTILPAAEQPPAAPAAAPAPQPAAATPPPPPARPATPPVRVAAQGNAPPAVQPVQPVRPAGNAPLVLNPNPGQAPAARPAAQAAAAPPPAPAAPATTAPVRQQTAAVTPAAPPPVAASGDYVVQLAARKSEDQALDAFATLKQRYASLLGRYQPLIERADLGDRGIYYRVRVGPLASQESAAQLCDQLKAAGSDCLVVRR